MQTLSNVEVVCVLEEQESLHVDQERAGIPKESTHDIGHAEGEEQGNPGACVGSSEVPLEDCCNEEEIDHGRRASLEVRTPLLLFPEGTIQEKLSVAYQDAWITHSKAVHTVPLHCRGLVYCLIFCILQQNRSGRSVSSLSTLSTDCLCELGLQ